MAPTTGAGGTVVVRLCGLETGLGVAAGSGVEEVGVTDVAAGTPLFSSSTVRGDGPTSPRRSSDLAHEAMTMLNPIEITTKRIPIGLTSILGPEKVVVAD